MGLRKGLSRRERRQLRRKVGRTGARFPPSDRVDEHPEPAGEPPEPAEPDDLAERETGPRDTAPDAGEEESADAGVEPAEPAEVGTEAEAEADVEQIEAEPEESPAEEPEADDTGAGTAADTTGDTGEVQQVVADSEDESREPAAADETTERTDAEQAEAGTDAGPACRVPDEATPEQVRQPDPEPEAGAADEAVEPAADPTAGDVSDAGEIDAAEIRSWVRPYVWTGGRTETSMEFALETLVSARHPEGDGPEVVRDEHRRVLELCASPCSVSEVAAGLSVPLGVAKALLSTMVEEGLVVVHSTETGDDGPSLDLMERVLRGLRNL